MRGNTQPLGFSYEWGDLCLDCYEGAVCTGSDRGTARVRCDARPVWPTGQPRDCTACGDRYSGPITAGEYEGRKRREGIQG